MNDERLMRMALDLARRGEGAVNPNPLVGAVVVRDGEIVGRGAHQRFGGPHAEVFALDEAGDAASGATLYVNLEPCVHHGKTPPCADRIIAAGIRRVVVACRDPNPLVDGKGIAALRAAGLEVEQGLLEAEATRLNDAFFKFIRSGRPLVHLKLAMSLDGKIATADGDARWISSQASRTRVHEFRRRAAAVLVGAGTVLSDDPALTVRHVEGRNPLRVVLDGSGRTPPGARLLREPGRTLIATAAMSGEAEAALRAAGAEVWRLPEAGDRIDLPALLERLGGEGIDSLLVEGGAETAASFLESNLIDKVSIFIAPILLGGRGAVPAIGGAGAPTVAQAARLRDVGMERIGDDFLVTGYLA
jgi:diaminohydroxyphosphoribosylaminopyrimidine deaminase / 5-amino-6-(5-phosphoribosylamino)uracil reductase